MMRMEGIVLQKRLIYKQIDRQTDRPTDQGTDRQADRQTDRQVDIFNIVLIATSSFDTNKTTEIFSMKHC